MRVTLIIDANDHRTDLLRFDIQTWLQFLARDQWRISEEEDNEEEDSDGLRLLTLDFRDPLDAVDFQQWRDIRRYVRRA